MQVSPLTLADLKARGYAYPRAKDCLASIVRKKILAGEELFPDIFGIDMQKRWLVEVMMTGRGALLTGAYGVAKTDLAKHVLGLLNEYYAQEQVFYVTQCPVQEDPGILLSYMAAADAGSSCPELEPCPICRKLIQQSNGGPAAIQVKRLVRLAEGTGFARVQGGGDVLPEEIIGTYNLLKLAEIGDPFDPRVFEPGKIGQSSRGLLFVDEIGKLPETAQHALIQAAQENIITPAKSRETFPVDFILVATSNPVDEEYICGAVRDRLVSIKIPLVGLEDELRIVRKEAEKLTPAVYIPGVFLKLAIEVVRAMRADERLTIGPRTSINAGLIARSSALLQGQAVASFCNIKEGIYTAILGKAPFEDRDDIESRIDQLFPEIASYLEREIPEVRFGALVQSYHAAYGTDAPWDAAGLKRLATGSEAIPELEHFCQWAYQHESIQKFRIYEVLAEYLSAYDRGCANNG
jgi:Mg-chelatase subunit ChlI